LCSAALSVDHRRPTETTLSPRPGVTGKGGCALFADEPPLISKQRTRALTGWSSGTLDNRIATRAVEVVYDGPRLVKVVTQSLRDHFARHARDAFANLKNQAAREEAPAGDQS
jgi:hypothetical protein